MTKKGEKRGVLVNQKEDKKITKVTAENEVEIFVSHTVSTGDLNPKIQVLKIA